MYIIFEYEMLNLNMKYRKKEFHNWIPKFTLKATNYKPKYL